MADTQTMSNDATVPRTKATAKYIRWGGLAAILGPLLVLASNVYQLWVTWTYGGGPSGPSPEALIETAPTATHIAFGGIRLLGGTLLVFGLIALYAYQAEAAGRLGLVGFVVSMIGTVLLTAVAWLGAFVDPALASQAPEFYVAARSGEIGGTVGAVLGIGVLSPILIQAIGWAIFGIATYRAGVYPRRAAVVLVVGALLLFVPVQGVPVVFQLAVAWLGFLLFSGRVETPSRKEDVAPSQSESIGS
jgi:hypothetical protein